MYLEPDAKRLHRDGDCPELDGPGHSAEEAVDNEASSIQEDMGDVRLIDHVHFEHCAHETFSEEFCVPSKGHSRPKFAKRAKDKEGDIRREDLEYLCETILTQEERKGYWEIPAESWKDESILIFEFETIAFVVQCEEKKLVRISEKDVAAMLGPCLTSGSESPIVKRVTARWSSHTDADKADFKWEIQCPREKTDSCPRTMNILQQRAKSLFKTRAQAEKKEVSRPDLLARCISQLKVEQ